MKRVLRLFKSPVSGEDEVIDVDFKETVEGVEGVEGTLPQCDWITEFGLGENARRLGEKLAEYNDFFWLKGGDGLIRVRPDGTTLRILKAPDLYPIIADRLLLTVYKNGKIAGELPPAASINAALRMKTFLGNFLPLNEVTTVPLYFGNFGLAEPGYNDRDGQQIYFCGRRPEISRSTNTIDRFLDVMAFAAEADRTNAVAAALTVRLRHHWLGAKPMVAVTAGKSHSGKSTVCDFVCGKESVVKLRYQSKDWPMEETLYAQLESRPGSGVFLFDNMRLDAGGGGDFIRSALFESLITSPEVVVSPRGRNPIRRPNSCVVVMNMNKGRLSEDLINRSLPIRLDRKGNVNESTTAIGNPGLEFLPQNREAIEAELRGMIEKWKEAGQPLDDAAKHPMTLWARTVGGILAVNGYRDFLSNASSFKTTDPKHKAIGILGANRPGVALRTMEWGRLARHLGVAEDIVSPKRPKTEEAWTREMGVALTPHLGEVFEGETETHAYRLRLVGDNIRWVKGKDPHWRYQFEVIEKKPRFPDTED